MLVTKILHTVDLHTIFDLVKGVAACIYLAYSKTTQQLLQPQMLGSPCQFELIAIPIEAFFS
jgi:hypothetical protein